MHPHKITKAVFPVAGLGFNFLPATKASPKEMMPIVDMPLIQYAVNEAIQAGITELIFITSSSKHAIEDHFDTNFELEGHLKKQKNYEMLKLVHNIVPEGISCTYVRQSAQLGLGHAILCAKQLIGDEAFAVLLADDLIYDTKLSCLQQLMEVYKEHHHSVIAVQKIPNEDTEKYGVVSVAKQITNVKTIIDHITEKPTKGTSGSDLAVVGRYIFTPKLMEVLERTKPDSDGQIHLTSAIEKLIKEEDVYALQFTGKRFDCGIKLEFLRATIAFALRRPELTASLKQVIRKYLNYA